MKLEQTTRRERILGYGGFKTGKSFCWLDIANTHYEAGNTDIKFYVIDSDFGVPKMFDEGFGHLEDCGMLTLYNPVDFSEMMKASMEIRKKAKQHDWIVIDMLDQAWTEAQLFYTRGVFGEDPADYFLQMRKEVVAKKGKDKRAFGGYEGTDWTFITRIYQEFEFPLTMKSPANVFAVTGERKLDSDRGDSSDKIKQYRPVGGMAPTGQKGIGHRFDTVLRMTKRANGQRQITMVGDRGREGVVWEERGSHMLDISEPPDAFTQQYLVNIAGWGGGMETKRKSQPKRSEGTGGNRRRRVPKDAKPVRRRK